MFVLELKALGEVNKFLGIGVTYDIKDGYHLEQAQSNCEPLTSPFGEV